MKKMVCMALLCLACGAAQAQNWKDVLGSVVNHVVGDKATTAASIVGTWQYSAPHLEMTSDNQLAQLGSALTESTVNKKLDKYYKLIKLNTAVYTFNEDGTYSCTIGRVPSTGTYTFDAEAKTIRMVTRAGIKTTAHVQVVGQELTLSFDADKLVTGLKSIVGAAAQKNSTASGISSLLKNCKGMKLGMKLKKK